MTEDMSSQDTTAVETAENTVETVVGNADEQASNQEVPSDFEPLTGNLRAVASLHGCRRIERIRAAVRCLTVPNRPLSRVPRHCWKPFAGNAHTPLEDRVFLAETMPFPNILVKLSTDESVEVRKAVAGNANDKNWLVGRLTKDESLEVRDVALRNKQTSWKMRLEGAQDPGMDSTALDFLGSLGVDVEPNAPAVLASMDT